MTRNRPIPPLLLPLLWSAAALLLLLLFTAPLLSQARLNRQSLALIWPVQSADNTPPVPTTPCTDYTGTLALMRTPGFAALNAQSQLDWLLEASRCWPPDRLPLLAPLTSERQWAVGQYDAVCDMLLAYQAPDKLLRLAIAEADAERWEGVEAGLGCIGRFPTDGAWISPFLVAPLYNRLGQQYESEGRLSAAISAWEAAGDWYPVVWADPYLRKATVLAQTGDNAAAIATLVDAVSRSTDETATFYLWHALRDGWQQGGNLTDAACAADRALAVMPQVPVENLPPAAREQFQTERQALPTPDPASCFAAWRTLQRESATP